MKKIYIAFIVLISMSSCKKLLDKQPLNNLTSEGYYKTQADAISGLIGAYNDFQNTQYIIHNYHCISEIAAGDSWEPNTNALGFTEFEKLQVTAANGDGKTLEIFAKAYGNIGKVNRVLAGLAGISATAEQKAQLEGEIRFMRALDYYYLVGLFGGVPILETAPVYDGNTKFTRATTAQTWNFIISDLTFAAANLPATRDAANRGRATRGSANGLLARVLAMRAGSDAAMWQRAKTAAQNVISDGYALDASYANNFLASGNYNKESLFEIGYNPTSSEGQGNQFSLFNTASFANGWSYGEAFSNSYNNFEAADLIRRRVSVYKIGDTPNNSTTVWTGSGQREFLIPSARGFVRAGTAKYNVSNNTDWAGTGADYKILRFAETLLIMAEAENELGNPTSALSYLAQVRSRVSLPTNMSLTDKSVIRELIFKDRMAELCMEGVKFNDLVQRKRGRDFKVKTFNPDNFVFPIPEIEIQRNGWAQNSSLTQAMKDEFMAGVIVDIR
ncbi:RagB/SusD family nutrient uptake outer membrane protein [Pedobacter sp. MC2016-05]|uniref:RagB/SusD family nutrient uptake outer membrane protein n=1 Tax=Pedobacter sp. MC2016-05 TaxID=2994474 RepID=UPI00224622EC|nr:RagB/SusD family nutrient uptake outer membrane protein [Pedobacter sp. MC2016-05]MCX2475319.1 RagB/SusD family nutrient uptake outer membrane protein [Pedobacter sp. MC2016-05]